MSEEMKLKLSLAKKGKVFSEEHRKKLSESHKGKIPTNLETFKRNRLGKTNSDEWKKFMSEKFKGRVMSDEWIEKIRLSSKGRIPWNKGLSFNCGPKNPNWIKDRTKLKKFNRQIGTAHKEWVEACKLRDGKRCKLTSKECAGQLEVHHIHRFSEHPELRYEITNGITLCHRHHPRTKQLEEKLRDTFLKLIS